MYLDVERATRYWLESAEYDLETGRSLIGIGRFPYVLFFGHLALEKLLKAIVVKKAKEHAPYTHSLTFLAEKTGLEISEELMDKLAEFTEFNIETRYPDERRDFYQKCTEAFTREKFRGIEEVYKWLRQRL
ncbi:MAG: HEPN domain-containing protein [Actinomycetota bacterium]|nr:HEPN domain-containing protein [Actinomycetota bacterium]